MIMSLQDAHPDQGTGPGDETPEVPAEIFGEEPEDGE